MCSGHFVEFLCEIIVTCNLETLLMLEAKIMAGSGCRNIITHKYLRQVLRLKIHTQYKSAIYTYVIYGQFVTFIYIHCSKFSKRNYIFPLHSQKVVTYFGQISPNSTSLIIRGMRTGRTSLNNSWFLDNGVFWFGGKFK